MKKIDKKILDKTFDFTIRFNSFVLNNPKIAEQIPANAYIVFKDNSDKKFTSANEELAREVAKRGDIRISATPVKNSWEIEKIERFARA